MNTSRGFSRREVAAIILSAGVIAVTCCYWIAQIAGVIEMLKLAYG